ncbi:MULTISPECIES: endonuclease V [Heyndrickxia]|uniref:Endonuclease V n=1 Tax=Heyndrickxia sporothermodurans TaxID=46224 RepID=A0AB37HCI2_9BACI|nr:endonuclease V [Heyndrickxia sporothermodurans]MBL5769226.1 endonuclease V [Heyndrickxia sporothermodurans]MBL5772995.1 endonuclease V [Heyndrickxia sporothermodurans]MBL5776457.1 endonuclease V [Heyndrickxia sporothermodurans]MBL5787098.1 endonuclease V [Heyndrickxia sporothermodurans]MBL5790667.1 endonuclease V [Heyndrickxia sporothermodurans]
MNKDFEEKYISIQKQLLPQVSLQNTFSYEMIHLIAGVDIAYWSENDIDHGVCCIVAFDFLTKKVVEQVKYTGEIETPYIPGFLAFRELPLILETVKRLKSSPDIYMFDGNGYLHYRHMGIATHASFYLEKPTIGVAKNYLKIKDVDFIMPDNQVGAYNDIVIDNEVYGRVLRSRKDVKPIFVSCGNWIDLDTATALTMHFVEKNSRLPAPTRYADIATHEARKNLKIKKCK